MRKINILTKSVYNRIAAGEVIDRPYSAVKELIENSLDAGATEIEIYIEGGGRELIRVVDNGCGIERDDLRAAFFPHATSKISVADDLDNITTLGFRGEALASISAISCVELTSVTEGNQAYKVTCEGGKVGNPEVATLENGTDIKVLNLFYNTPVRLRFLKTDKKEEADIANFVTRFILGNPEVSFKYFIDGELQLQSQAGGLEESIVRVYGSKVLSQCFKINAEKNAIKISGFIGNQNFFKPNRTYQTLFLNGRYIINNTITTAITNAYSSYAMKRQYPFYVLNIDMPSDMVDVNVHPNKADVRLTDNRMVYGIIYSVISSILDGTATAAQFVVDSVRTPEIISTIDENKNKVYITESKKFPQSEPVKSQNAYQQPIEPIQQIKQTKKPESKNTVQKNKPITFNLDSVGAITEAAINSGESKEKFKYYDPTSDIFFDFSDSKPKAFDLTVSCNNEPSICNDARVSEIHARRMHEQQMIEFEECKYKGELFKTYLIYEMCDTVYLIDQHAAHERLLYDTMREKMAKEEWLDRQSLLIPYLFPVNAEEKEFIESCIYKIRQLGFDLKPYGLYGYRVDEFPSFFDSIDLKDFFDSVLADMNELKDIELVDVFKDKIATMACKSAVKAGRKLTDAEVKKLFEMLKGNMGLKCPHGRPICVTLAKKDIEKMFKRIV